MRQNRLARNWVELYVTSGTKSYGENDRTPHEGIFQSVSVVRHVVEPVAMQG